jgi:hypothetical protein
MGVAWLALASLPGRMPEARQLPKPFSFSIPGRSNSTPWIAANGPFVAVVWGATAAGKTDVFLAVSRNAGESFDSPVQINKEPGEARLGGELPPRVALTATPTSRLPEIVVLWTARGDTTTLKLARSRDGGRTFGSPELLHSSPAAGDRGWPALALDPRGGAHAIWLDHRGLASTSGTEKKGHAAHAGSAHDGVAMAQKSGLYYSAGAGPAARERELAKGVCYCCKTALVARSDGVLFASWRHVYPGNLRDIALSVSRDRGRSFSPPVRVSEDGWAINGCPDDGPAMAADASGVVHIVWPTVISDPDPQGAIFYSSTRDGAAFTPRVRIPTLGSPRPMHPQIALDGAGRIIVAWDELIEGQRVAVARELKQGSDRTLSPGPVIKLGAGEPASYPVLAATSSGFVAVWTEGGRIEGARVPGFQGSRVLRF